MEDALKIGVVIGTFASVPYVHLGLEALRRNEPNVKVLVHDDSSGQQVNLKSLCEEYGAEFRSTKYRMAPVVGDVSSFMTALQWGEASDLDVVCKFSRRWIVYRKWTEELERLVRTYGYSTYSEACAHFSFGFRSECVAMVVKDWIPAGVLPEFEGYVERNERPGDLPEGWYHAKAQDVHRRVNEGLLPGDKFQQFPEWYKSIHHLNERYTRTYGIDGSHQGYGKWPLMGMSRCQEIEGVLWHDVHGAKCYALLAQTYGLPYTSRDFEDPNMGEGSRPT